MHSYELVLFLFQAITSQSQKTGNYIYHESGQMSKKYNVYASKLNHPTIHVNQNPVRPL